MTQTAAQIFAAFCLGVLVFQLCLIGGAPWGHLTQGGSHPGKLPASRRVAAAASACLMLAMAAAILSAAGGWPHWPRWTGWGTLGLMVLSAGMNLATPSRAERLLWGPVTLAMLGLTLVVMI